MALRCCAWMVRRTDLWCHTKSIPKDTSIHMAQIPTFNTGWKDLLLNSVAENTAFAIFRFVVLRFVNCRLPVAVRTVSEDTARATSRSTRLHCSNRRKNYSKTVFKRRRRKKTNEDAIRTYLRIILAYLSHADAHTTHEQIKQRRQIERRENNTRSREPREKKTLNKMKITIN